MSATEQSNPGLNTGPVTRPEGEPWYLRHIPGWVMPNHLTYLRFALGLGMIWLDMQGVSMGWIIIMGLIAGASDLLDGALARSRNLTSRMGAVLDPIGDKLFAVVLALMVWNRGYVAGWLLLCLLICEIHAVLVPLVVFGRRIRAGVPLLPLPKLKVNRWGKVKTAWLASAMGLVLIFHFMGFTTGVKFAILNIWIAFGLGLVAEYIYLKEFLKGEYK